MLVFNAATCFCMVGLHKTLQWRYCACVCIISVISVPHTARVYLGPMWWEDWRPPHCLNQVQLISVHFVLWMLKLETQTSDSNKPAKTPKVQVIGRLCPCGLLAIHGLSYFVLLYILVTSMCVHACALIHLWPLSVAHEGREERIQLSELWGCCRKGTSKSQWRDVCMCVYLGKPVSLWSLWRGSY